MNFTITHEQMNSVIFVWRRQSKFNRGTIIKHNERWTQPVHHNHCEYKLYFILYTINCNWHAEMPKNGKAAGIGGLAKNVNVWRNSNDQTVNGPASIRY